MHVAIRAMCWSKRAMLCAICPQSFWQEVKKLPYDFSTDRASLRASLHFFVGKHIKLRGAHNFARRFGGELKRSLLIPFNNWVNIPNLAI
ncbi:hypothetical protein LCGC14_0623730 [marine sediment metagenome]|uniref:Uncharacterized protein n=1 Tax=marine sediment metagenome TaxID=412755 RepID=A0A0F9RNE6_9ZZZZ